MKARNVAVAASEAVQTVEASLEMEVDSEMPLESLFELEQRDVVIRVQQHALCTRVVRHIEVVRKSITQAVESFVDVGVESLDRHRPSRTGRSRAEGPSGRFRPPP